MAKGDLPKVAFNGGTYSVIGMNDKGYLVRFDGFTTRALAEEFTPYVRMGATNPVVHSETAYEHTIRRYANDMWDACDGPIANISPGFASFEELETWLTEQAAAKAIVGH